ncbi:rhamnulokinase [Mangrovibacterium diazotrophicum]|uniref:Rhamnulokinase n=1 Tax=Mangrovibacterium diazotrophicum TaxID=1261403 RepID=A0A419VUB0_9BACT|nr:rhamnulokinase [Mangrovibacterium diazotrophicum]RKD85024.1 L-rhamnulokinase [Mangrovibacterium diazotrophicum]
MPTHHFLAFDLGASSGRAILGTLEKSNLQLTEVHRFVNQMQRINGHYFWNIFSLFQELKTGLSKCVRELGIQPESIAVDTWGVDFAHIGADGMILSLPYAYRDPRTNSAMDDLFQLVPKNEVYRQTGIQFMQFNSLFQLYSMVKSGSSLLPVTKQILFTPDALNYLFSGVAATEFTIASTSQMLVPGKCEWQKNLIEAAGIPLNILGKVILPGQQIGTLLPEIAEETGSSQIPVVAVAGHDTASAIASVPAEDANFAYISSGTWSIFGIETTEPIISDKTLELNFTNEGGVEGTTRFLKNIMGMWLIQECRRIWAREKEYSWPEMVELAKTAEPFRFVIDPDDNRFLNPENMPEAVVVFCEETGQGKPESHAQIIRCIYDSLALKYRQVLDEIRSVTDKRIERIHMIGGGCNNDFLNQLTADVCELPVFAGPTEATATGNILMQAKALGVLSSLNEIRKIVRESFKLKIFQPSGDQSWRKAYQIKTSE